MPTWYPSHLHQTNGNFVQRHVEAIATKTTSTVLFIARDPDQKKSFVIKDVELENYRELKIFYRGKGLLFRLASIIALMHFLAFCIGLSRIGKCNGFHIHVLDWKHFPILLLWRCRYIITEHWTGYHNDDFLEFGWFRKTIIKRLAKKAKVICPVSDHLGRAMRNCGLQGNYQSIGNVVNTNLFKPSEEKRHGSSYKFLHVSSLIDKHKNINGILRAVKNLESQGLDFHFSLLGDGPFKHWQEEAKKLRIADSILKIEGEQSVEEIAKRMQQTDCFVLFSNYENQPCVLLEAISSGLPYISTDVGGISEFSEESYSILISKGEEETLAAEMKNCIKGKFTERDRIRMHSSAEFNNSIAAIARKFEDVYAQSF